MTTTTIVQLEGCAIGTDAATAEHNTLDLESMSINLTGPMLGMQAIAPLMGPGSSIVNTGSAAAVTPHYTVSYTASKWGLRGLTHVAATEYGARGIRVNIVHPGYIETPMMAAAPLGSTPCMAAIIGGAPVQPISSS